MKTTELSNSSIYSYIIFIVTKMVLEVAMLDVKTGMENEFESDFSKATKYLVSINGYITHSLRKCLEKKNRYLLLVEWNKLEDHTIGFRGSPQYTEWKKLLHHFYDPFPVVEHYH